MSAPSAEVAPTAVDDAPTADVAGTSAEPSRARRRLAPLVVTLLTLAPLALVWLSLVAYVRLADWTHPGGSGAMTGADLVQWANRALLVMLTGVGRDLDSPPGSGVGLALVAQLALFLGLAAWSVRRWARAVGWRPGWGGALCAVLPAGAAVGVLCLVLADSAIPGLRPLQAVAVPAAITAGVLLSALWPRAVGTRARRVGAGVGLGWRMFGLSLLPGLVFLPAALTHFYGSWGVLRDQWYLHLLNTLPQDFVGAAAFSFGGLYDGFDGETGLMTGELRWGYQFFPLVQTHLALLLALRFLVLRRRGSRVGLELLSAFSVFLGVWAVAAWLVHFTADPRQYAKYSTGWGPQVESTLALMAVLVGVPLLLVAVLREVVPGWVPRTAAWVGGRSTHPTWAAAIAERLDRDGRRGSARMRSVRVTEKDRGGRPLPNGALVLVVAGLNLGCALSLAVLPAGNLPDCGPMFRAAFVADLPVPDRQPPADVQRHLDDLEAKLGVAKQEANVANDAAAEGRRLRARRDALRAELAQVTEGIRSSRSRIAAAEAQVGLMSEASQALDDSRKQRRQVRARLARTTRALASEQEAMDAARAAQEKVQRLTDQVVLANAGWRAQHMAVHSRAVDHNSLAAQCRAEGRSRLTGSAFFGLASVMLLWFGAHTVTTRRRIAAGRTSD